MEWFLALLNVMFMNTVLSGDNSIVISLAANRLPNELRKKAIVWGSATAIVLRVVLLVVGIYLVEIPFFKIASAILLLWVAVQLILDSVTSHDKEQQLSPHPHHEAAVTIETEVVDGRRPLIKAIRTIAIADFVMSLDNAVAMIGAANGYKSVLLVGLLITVPLLIWGSQLMSKILQRFSWLILLAVAILGWTAGEMFVDDSIFRNAAFQDTMQWLVPIVFGIGVFAFAIVLTLRTAGQHKEPKIYHES